MYGRMMLLMVMLSPSIVYQGVYSSESSGLAESGVENRLVRMAAAAVAMVEPVICGAFAVSDCPRVSDRAVSCELHPGKVPGIAR